MNINSVNIALGASYGAYSQKLTQQTKEKLESLNIPYEKNITEDEGKKLIKMHNAQKEENQSQTKGGNDLFKRAQKLAEKLGIQTSEGENFAQLLKIIETVLEQKISSASNNEKELLLLKGLSQELASIQAQSNGSSGYNNTNQALLMSLEILGQYNKNYLNR